MKKTDDQMIGITEVDVDLAPKVYANRFRRKRFGQFIHEVVMPVASKVGRINILDIGGVIPYWEGVRDLWSHLPLDITLINIGAQNIDKPPYFIRGGDACDLAQYADNSFDIVHSNSVIEHVGHWLEMKRMADEVKRLAPHYFVQTPNFYFPLEPHYRTLFFQWYPEILRARMMTTKKRGFCDPLPTLGEAMIHIQSVNLLTGSQMKELFPEGEIKYESLFGLRKSIMAIR